MKTDLTVIEFDKARHNQTQGGYKYLIRDGVYSYEAYVTDKGFQDWIARTNLKLELTDSNEFTRDGELVKSKTYKAIGTIEDKYFWSMDELPENKMMFKGLSNGSLVDCFYTHTENGSLIFRPNPNAKDVYKPMPLNEHIEYKRVNG